ncbi:hypothetical protein Pfo_031579, partial [Paulownia fortunei]
VSTVAASSVASTASSAAVDTSNLKYIAAADTNNDEAITYIAAADTNKDGYMTMAEYNAYKANGAAGAFAVAGAAQVSANTITVKAGDTLNKIAAANGTTVAALASANNISNVNLIFLSTTSTSTSTSTSSTTNQSSSNSSSTTNTSSNTTSNTSTVTTSDATINAWNAKRALLATDQRKRRVKCVVVAGALFIEQPQEMNYLYSGTYENIWTTMVHIKYKIL